MIDDYAALRALALSLNLPRTEGGTAWARPCLRAHGRFWTWWSPYIDAAVFHCPVDEGEMLRAADPDTFAEHPHYAGHPFVLVRAGRINPDWASARLVARWRALAPKRWLRAWDAAQAGGEG